MRALAGQDAARRILAAAVRARAWWAYSRIYEWDPRRALDTIQPALALYRALGDERGIAACLVEEAGTRGQLAEPERARELAGEALALARRAGDAVVAADAELLLAMTAEDHDERLHRGAAMERVLVRLGRHERRIQLLGMLGLNCVYEGDTQRGRELLARARALVGPRDHPSLLAGTQGNEGIAAIVDGDLETAAASSSANSRSPGGIASPR